MYMLTNNRTCAIERVLLLMSIMFSVPQLAVLASPFPGLRRRIATLFLQYCKTPLFNAEAAKHIKVRVLAQ